MKFWSIKRKKKAQQSLREEHFLLGFLQNKKDKNKMIKKVKEGPMGDKKDGREKVVSKGPTMDYSKYREDVKSVLSELGLETWYKKESKQRVEMFMLLDDGGKGLISFREFWQLLK
jgi:hypothetical protein